MQITNTSYKEILGEIALQCGDPFYNDFKINIYMQAKYRSERSLAKQYKILERKWTHTTTELEAEVTTEIVIPQLNFYREVLLIVNGEKYEKVNNELDNTLNLTSSQVSATTTIFPLQYYIRYDSTQYVLNYTNKAEGDEVSLFYISAIAGSEDYEETDSEGNVVVMPVMPDHFTEEIIRRGVTYIAKLGIATFVGEKKQKYADILKMNAGEEHKASLARDDQWTTVKPYTGI
jgi:hypothetical protein